MASEILTAWLLTIALHASVLLGVAWLIDRGSLRARPAWREMLWRAAFFGGIVTASAQVLFQAPASARITLLTNSTHSAALGGMSSMATVQPAKDRPEKVVPAEQSTEATQSPTAKSIVQAKTITSGDATKPSPRKTPFGFPSWHLMLIAGWLAGALIALARLAATWLRLKHSLMRAEPIDSAQLATDATALAIQAGIQTPRLGALDELASPIAARGRILLPCWSVELLDREQLRAMLAHETAHIARRDPEWKFAIAAWCALFWFVPLAPLARRRLDEVAEISCDAWAAIHLGDGRSLAECLAECAERRIGGVDIALAPAMAGCESPLLRRIDYLIAGVPMNTSSAGMRAGIAVVAALAIGSFALPGVSIHSAAAQSAPPIPPAPPVPSAPSVPSAPAVPPAPAVPAAPATSEGHHVHVSSDISIHGRRDLTIVEVNDSQHGYSVKIDGKVEFNDNEDDIASLSDGGTATLSETRQGKTQRVEITSRGGKLERRYFVDNKEQPLDADARKWMAALIPRVIRETAIDAEGRVKRIRAKGGVDAVLDEIAHIDSGYARGVYLRALAGSGKLTSAQMTRALELVDAIDSDYEKRNALAALAAVQPLDASQQKLVLAQADKIKSDYERAELLVGILPQLAPADDVRVAWLKAASGISSDYEHRRTLSAMLDSGHADEATLTAVVDAAHTIGSDYERRELLTSAVKRTHDAEKLAVAYAGAASKIGSDYERREALIALIRAQGFGKGGTRAVLDALSGIGSDYDCREVLVALASVMPNDSDLIARYRTVARRLSDYERGQAERALDHFTS